MKMLTRTTIAVVVAALALAAAPAPLLATTATSFSSFEGEEESTQRYYPGSGTFANNDTYDNMTSPSSGTFKFELRYNTTWWDGDRDTGNTDRGRVEVKGLGELQGQNETFRYKSTWKTSGWKTTSVNKFCHITQLKAIDGNNGAPLVVQSVNNGAWTANVRYCTTAGSCADGLTVAREYAFSSGVSKTVEIHIKTSTGTSGEVKASVDGDAFSGHTGKALYLTDSTAYRPKWGLYRGFATGMGLGTHSIEHSSVTAGPYSGSSPTPTPTPTAVPGATPTPTPTPVPGATATPTPAPGGSFSGYYKLIGQATGKALVVQSASTANSASVIVYDYAPGGTPNDDWQILSIGSGYYRIINRNSGKDMTVASASTAGGANIIQYPYGGTNTNDEWQIVDSGSGYYEIRCRMSGKNIQAMGTSNSSAVQQQSDNNATDQRFQPVSVP